MSGAIVVSTYSCTGCRAAFTSGAAAPSCPYCRSSSVERSGTAATIPVPEPVPAGSMPEAEALAAGVARQLGTTAPLTWRCPFCPWSTTWRPPDEPAGIDEHLQAQHPAEVAP